MRFGGGYDSPPARRFRAIGTRALTFRSAACRLDQTNGKESLMPLRHLALSFVAAASLPFLATTTAVAVPPEHVTVPIDNSFSFDDCGFVVDGAFSGTFHVTLFRNSAGLVIQERDGGSDLRSTLTNEQTGKTVTSVNSASAFFDYGSGAVIGSSVTITIVGMNGRLPGVGPDAGRVVLTGTVVDFDPNFGGAPAVDIPDDQDPLFLAGHHPDQDICAALS